MKKIIKIILVGFYVFSLISLSCLSPLSLIVHEPTPTPAFICSMDQIMTRLRRVIFYQQNSLAYTIDDEEAVLHIWFVDYYIQSEDQSLDTNVNTAIYDAIKLAFQVVNYDSCVSSLFDSIVLIAVDAQYNGWLSIKGPTSAIPSTDNPTTSEIQEVASNFEATYLRETTPKSQGSSPFESCTWVQAEQAIRQHFAATRPNVTFFFVIDEAGTNVWAHWDGPTDNIAFVLANLLNIMIEIRCLHPAPTQLFAIIVDKYGILQQIGLLPVEGITTTYYSDYMSLLDGYQILYER